MQYLAIQPFQSHPDTARNITLDADNAREYPVRNAIESHFAKTRLLAAKAS